MQYRIAIILGAILASGSLLMPADDEPELEIRASPRIAIMSNRAIEVSLMVVITDADEDHWCPEYTIEWGDGERSTYEFDCVPFEEATARERERATEPFYHWYRRPGTMHIRVRLRKADRTINTSSTIVELT